MKMPKVLTPVVEEVWYLTHNKSFLSEVKEIRIRYDIPLNGVPNIKDWREKHWSIDKIENMQSFQKEIVRLESKSRIGKSKHFHELWYYLHQYVLTNHLSEIYENAELVPLPNIEIENVQNKVTVTLWLDYDAGKGEINKLISGSWRKIRQAQKELAGELLEPSLGFEFKSKIWEENQVEKISEEDLEIEYPDLSKYELRKLIKRMNQRIASSFE